MVNKATRSHEKTIETAIAVNALDSVKKAAYHIVSTWSLTAGKNHSDIDWLSRFICWSLLETQFGETVGVWEKLLDFFLVVGRLCGLPLTTLTPPVSTMGNWGL